MHAASRARAPDDIPSASIDKYYSDSYSIPRFCATKNQDGRKIRIKSKNEKQASNQPPAHPMRWPGGKGRKGMFRRGGFCSRHAVQCVAAETTGWPGIYPTCMDSCTYKYALWGPSLPDRLVLGKARQKQPSRGRLERLDAHVLKSALKMSGPPSVMRGALLVLEVCFLLFLGAFMLQIPSHGDGGEDRAYSFGSHLDR
jgi:hypothetical protein